MDLLKSCFTAKESSGIYLADNDNLTLDNEQQWCFCFPKRKVIQLSGGNGISNDNELDSQVLLDRPYHDINEFLSPPQEWWQEEDSFAQENVTHTEYNPLKRNIAQSLSFLEAEADAESLSEHKITSIIDTLPKKNSTEESSTISQPTVSRPLIANINTNDCGLINLEKSNKDILQPIIPGSVFVDSPTELVDMKRFSANATAIIHPAKPIPIIGKDFPVVGIVKAPYQPVAPMQHDLRLSVSPHTISGSSNTRRPSVVTVAQSVLGEKLDDFTEKLATIKKNIIMNASGDRSDSSDDDTVDDSISDQRQRDKQPWDSIVARFNKPPSGQLLQTRKHMVTNEEEELSDFYDEEELFNFSKVAAIGKNVRTFGQEVVGSNIRNVFNNLSTRIKNAHASP